MPNQDAQRSIQNAISVCQELSKDQSVKTIKRKRKRQWSLNYLLYSLLPNIMWQKIFMGFFIHCGIATDF